MVRLVRGLRGQPMRVEKKVPLSFVPANARDNKNGTDMAPSSTILTDGELVVRAQQDNAWAFEQLVRRYQQKAFAIAFQMGNGDREEAKDITQQAFLNAYRSIKTFKRGASFYTWFYRILINACYDARRRHVRWRQLFFPWSRKNNSDDNSNQEALDAYPDPDSGSIPDAACESKELDHALRKALLTLPEKQRQAFQLKLFHGLSVPEISEIMNIRPGTIKSHLFRATRSIRAALSEWEKPRGR